MWLNRAARTLELAAAGPTDLISWLAEHDWSPETRKSARNSLRSFYSWAVEHGHLHHNPAARLPTVRVPPTTPRPTPCDVLRAALQGASARDRLLIGCAAFAGLRRSEIAALRWDHITWDGVRVVGKGGRGRTVPLLPALAGELRLEAERRSRGLVGDGYRFEPNPASPYVFPGRFADQHMSPETVGALLARRLGKGWSGHTLRHRFATMAYAVNRDLLTVQQLLGHSRPETTARYTAVPPGAAAEAVQGAAA